MPEVVAVLEEELKLLAVGLLVETPEAEGDLFGAEDGAEVIPEISDDNLWINRQGEKYW